MSDTEPEPIEGNPSYADVFRSIKSNIAVILIKVNIVKFNFYFHIKQ